MRTTPRGSTPGRVPDDAAVPRDAVAPLSTRGRADLHIHPVGDGTTVHDPDAFLRVLAASGLDLAVLTDHERIDVAVELAARAAGQSVGPAIFVGEEIGTREGDVLGLGLRTRIAPGLSLGDSVAAIHGQGGLAIVAHPLLPLRISAQPRLLGVLAEGAPERRPDALESLNARVRWLPLHRRRIEALAARAGYAVVGGSDAHRPDHVGRAVTRFPGSTVADLRAAIEARSTTAEDGRRGVAE